MLAKSDTRFASHTAGAKLPRATGVFGSYFKTWGLRHTRICFRTWGRAFLCLALCLGGGCQQLWGWSKGRVCTEEQGVYVCTQTDISDRMWAIWGKKQGDQTDVWVGGENGSVMHWNGQLFEPVAGSCASGRQIDTIWGAGSNDVWFGGKNSLLMHWDGNSFSCPQFDLGDITSIQGNGDPMLITANVAARGRLFRWKPTDVQPIPIFSSSGQENFQEAWAPTTAVLGSPQTVWVVGRASAAGSGRVYSGTDAATLIDRSDSVSGYEEFSSIGNAVNGGNTIPVLAGRRNVPDPLSDMMGAMISYIYFFTATSPSASKLDPLPVVLSNQCKASIINRIIKKEVDQTKVWAIGRVERCIDASLEPALLEIDVTKQDNNVKHYRLGSDSGFLADNIYTDIWDSGTELWLVGGLKVVQRRTY